jgi:hypothetical protein
LFACVQIGLHALNDYKYPELHDPEYGYRLMHLRQRLKQEKGRTVVLALGSSLTAMGFRPDAFTAALGANGAPPTVFNFATLGGGPLAELLVLRHLLADRVHPDWVFIEILPPILHQEAGYTEEDWFHLEHARWRDTALLCRHLKQPKKHWRWCVAELTPAFSHRFALATRFAPEWLPKNSRQENWRYNTASGGWLMWGGSRDADEQCRRVEHIREQYARFFQNFHVSAGPDGAVRELLCLCRQQRIKSSLVLMPEGSVFRSYYGQSPTMSAQLDGYLESLSQAYGVGWVDARSWLGDESFFDSQHLFPEGATAFSERLGREVSALISDATSTVARPSDH